MSISSTAIKGARLENPYREEFLPEEFLKLMSLSQSELARAVHAPPGRMNENVPGHGAVTADTDLRLARSFAMSEGFFPGIQSDYDLTQRRRQIGASLMAVSPRAAEVRPGSLRVRTCAAHVAYPNAEPPGQ